MPHRIFRSKDRPSQTWVDLSAAVAAYLRLFNLSAAALRKPARLGLVLALTLPAFSQSATEKTLYSLTQEDAGGSAAVIQASDGNYYAAISSLTVSADWNLSPYLIPGAFLQITPSGAVTVLSSITQNDVTIQSLIEGQDGNFYGVSPTGGNGNGMLFRFNPAGQLSILYNFSGGIDGSSPTSLIQVSDGSFYGTAAGGGSSDDGVIFHYSPGLGMETIYTFTGTGDSGVPESILEGSDGNFYGTTSGVTEPGAVFKMTPSGALSLLYSFDSDLTPFELAEGGDGNFYGLAGSTSQPASASFFQVAPDGTGSILHSFTADEGYPIQLLQGSEGNFYSTSYTGGANGVGSFLQMTQAGNIQVLYSFPPPAQGGANPLAVVQGSDGNFYGIARFGGTNDDGTLFELLPTQPLTAPVHLSLSAGSVSLGGSVNLVWGASNAYSFTSETCFATSFANAGNWSGMQTGSSHGGIISGSAVITPLKEGNFTYSITCGGVNSAVAELTVDNAASNAINLSSNNENFGEIADGKSKSIAVSVTNDTGAIFPFSLAVTGDASFSQTNTCGSSIAPKKSCKIFITYTAAAGMNETDTAQFTIANQGALFVPSNEIFSTASALPSGKVKLSGTSHNFGNVRLGTSSSFGLNIRNSANGPASLNYSSGNMPAQYSVANNCPDTLAAGDGCVVTFTFTPSDTSMQNMTFAVSSPNPFLTTGSITLSGN